MARVLNDETLTTLLGIARLDLPAERYEAVKAATETVFALADALDDIELGETAPATAYDARWE